MPQKTRKNKLKRLAREEEEQPKNERIRAGHNLCAPVGSCAHPTHPRWAAGKKLHLSVYQNGSLKCKH